MVRKIYVELGSENEVLGWGSSPISEGCIKMELEEGNEFFNDIPFMYKYESGNLKKISLNNDLIVNRIKEEKKVELNKSCNEDILSGFDCEVRGTPYHFSYDKEAQSNLYERWQLFQNDMISSIKVTAHIDNTSHRLNFDKDDFSKLYLASVQHKENCISRYRDDLLPLVDQAMTVEQVEAITWNTVVVEPVPSLVVVEDHNTLDKKVEGMKVAQAEGDLELLMLMYSMGVLG